MLNRLRLVPAGLIAAAVVVFSAGTAQASTPIQISPNCNTSGEAQVFQPWGDSAQYVLAPDGNFAASAASWSLTGGAAAVAGGDGYSLGGAAPSTQSLSLPDGSSATTPTICAGLNTPSFRFFARNTGSPNSTLLVSATVNTTLGLNLTIPVADITATSTWSPSSVVPMIANLVSVLPNNMTSITLSFAPVGTGGNWQVDDLYVDPWQRGPGG